MACFLTSNRQAIVKKHRDITHKLTRQCPIHHIGRRWERGLLEDWWYNKCATRRKPLISMARTAQFLHSLTNCVRTLQFSLFVSGRKVLRSDRCGQQNGHYYSKRRLARNLQAHSDLVPWICLARHLWNGRMLRGHVCCGSYCRQEREDRLNWRATSLSLFLQKPIDHAMRYYC